MKDKIAKLLDDAYSTLRRLTPNLEKRGLGALARSVRARLSKLKLGGAVNLTLAMKIFRAASAVDLAAKSALPDAPKEVESRLGELGELLRQGLGDDAS
jgi:hypothetical protein